ncbi:metal-dependent hydrolase family protein [Azohydromonas aeria]|uniref:metal-dependent hydrolase family protein n=1 Tax=Azohydromonas aeria TaxID=2590212 RepID=UPI0012F92777|nr:amidohydrolase family protein [Azohydromonas aeria]
MSDILFTNARVFDASGAQPFDGEVLVQGNRITQVRRGRGEAVCSAGTQVIDAAGAFLMPGMTEAHTHFAWNDQPTLASIQMMPPEEHALWCIRVAKRYLDMGWTSCVGAATAKPRLDVVTRNAIGNGEFPGPRYIAGSQEIAHLGGLGDMSLPHLPFEELSFAHVVSGPEEMRKAVRMFAKYGVDQIKLNLSGEFITGLPAELTPFSDEEVAMATAEARRLGKRVAAHARSAESVKQCVRHGIEVIYHASFADEEALDMLEANKDKHFVAPGLAWLVNTCFHAKDYGITTEAAAQMGYMRELEAATETMHEMHKRGIRILPGGDYGFAWVPHGTNANDLQYLVKYAGMTPMESLLAATARGGEIMMRPNELGQIREGYLADLLLVDGDPLQDLSVLLDAQRLLAIMKDGVFHKAPHVV